MKLFACFGGAAAVADDDAAAAAAASQQSRRRPSFRGKFFSKKKKKLPSGEAKRAAAPGSVHVDDHDCYVGRASSVASSGALSSAASLDSAASSSPSLSSRSSTASSMPSSSSAFLMGTLPPAASVTTRQATPAAGAVAMLLCLVMVVFCGRVGATLLTSTALYLFPRRWPAARWSKTKAACEITELPECDAASSSEAEEDTAKRKAVTKGFFVRNRKT
ncbi:hypothetical protein ACP70R_004516 [Stipagrostis hirtigluma subsp. patula]